MLGSLRADAATFSFTYTDPAGFGFNETDPATPVGGNPGTTLGEQRRNVMEQAANIWAPYLQSDVTIVIEARFSNFGGTPTSATIAAAGPETVLADFAGAPQSNTWYVSALADSLSGQDQDTGSSDLNVTVNEDIDSNPNVLGGDGFYYGYDHESGSQTDLLSTLLHEIGHGLGFLSTADESDGSLIGNTPDSFTRLMFDTQTNQNWGDMSDAERQASAINDPDLVFIGPAATQASQRQLKPAASSLNVAITAPVGSAADFTAGTSAFGLGIPPWGLQGVAVLAIDGTSPVNDGCEGPLSNANDLLGNIAVIDRGNCNFTVKVGNAQEAGAIGVIIINNAGDDLITMSGNNENVSIPSVFIGQTDGNALKAALVTDTVQITITNTGDLQGTQSDSVRLFGPSPVDPGSSASHWSVDTFPDLLMEPIITDTFLPQLDLSVVALRDIGWNIQNIDLPYLTYSLWAEENIGSVNAAETDNADGDPWNNFAEYAFGSDPTDADNQPVSSRFLRTDTSIFALFYTRNKLAGDVIYSLMSTPNLGSATNTSINGVDYIGKAVTEIDDETEQPELEVRSSAAQSFFEIEAQRYSPAPGG